MVMIALKKAIDHFDRLRRGGGEESRTPVQQAFHINFFEHSLFYLFLKKQVNKQTYFISSFYIPTTLEAEDSFVSYLFVALIKP